MNEETALIKVNPLVDPMVLSLQAETAIIREKSLSFVIASIDDMKLATEDLSIISRLKKALKEARLNWTAPIKEQLESVDTPFKTMLDDIDRAEKTLKGLMLAYQQEIEKKRRAAEELDRQAQELARKQAEMNGGEFTVDTTPVLRPDEAPKKVHTELGGTGTRDNWKYEITDVGLLPREYMVPDTAMLNMIAKKHHDAKPIPGVRFYNKPIIATYTR